MAGDDKQETQCDHSGGAARARGNLRNTTPSTQNVQQISSFKIDKAKHKVFLSHSGAQKDFVEQLCVDLEARAYMFPFFDQRHHSLPKGKDFVPFIKEAAQRCRVAVIVLSNQFLLSKWPMIELAEFHAAQQAGNQQLNMLPLFYKLAVVDLEDRAIKDKWMPRWRKLAEGDRRIDVEKWGAAVRALRKANGLVFGKHSMTEVDYRKEIVQSISQLSPPDLLYGSSREMVGCDRMCKIASSRFVNDGSAGPSLLGLYGMTGRGKTILCKALCDHFSAEFLGRVCHVDLGEMSTMDLQEMMLERPKLMLGRPKLMLKRVKLMLKNLCGFERDVLDRVTDYSQGLELLRDHVHREPVFLALDNVTGDESSLREAREYLKVGFHPKSRILITSRSVVNVQDLLPGSQFCMAMPKLTVKEAGEIFLRSAAPMKSISGLTDEELRIVGLCIQHCLFESEGFESQGDDLLLELDDESEGNESDDESEGDESDRDSRDSDSDEVSCEPDVEEKQFLSESELRESRLWSFHPVALSALGDFLRRYSGNKPMLLWKNEFQSYLDQLKNIWRCSDGIGRMINLQFSSLDPRERLLFLDLALYFPIVFNLSRSSADSGCWWLEWLSELHGDSESFLRRQLHDLTRSSMIKWDDSEDGFRLVNVPTVYKEFAEWYATEHGLRELSKNSFGVLSGGAQKHDFRLSDLVRLRVFDLSRASARLLASKTMKELYNLEVLHLHRCPNLTELNIQGLDSLRDLELVGLDKLVTVTLSGSSGADENGGIFESLRSVRLIYLDSLTHGPDLRSCTSLHWLNVSNCPKWTNLEQISECRDLKSLELDFLNPQQWASIPIVESLPSLQYLSVRTDGYVGLNDVIYTVEGLECWDQAFMLKELLGHLRSVIPVDNSSRDVVYFEGGHVIITWTRRWSGKLEVFDSKYFFWEWE